MEFTEESCLSPMYESQPWPSQVKSNLYFSSPAKLATPASHCTVPAFEYGVSWALAPRLCPSQSFSFFPHHSIVAHNSGSILFSSTVIVTCVIFFPFHLLYPSGFYQRIRTPGDLYNKELIIGIWPCAPKGDDHKVMWGRCFCVWCKEPEVHRAGGQEGKMGMK